MAGTLDIWVKPTTRPKRKRVEEVNYDTTKSTTKPIPKPTNNPKQAQKLYNDTLKALDKGVNSLDRRVKTMNGNSWEITTSEYASAAAKHLPAAEKLIDIDPKLAFNLLLSLADASHTDLDASCKMGGEPSDDSTPTFKELDEALLPLIERREKPSQQAVELVRVPHRWTRKDADVGSFKTGRPNKQQRNQMYAQKLEWKKERCSERRARREEEEDWVKVTLSDLVEERDYLEKYGVEQYLPISIAKLEEMVAERTT